MKYKVLYSIRNTGWEDSAEAHFLGLFTEDEKICDFVSKTLEEEYKGKNLTFDKVYISETGNVLHQGFGESMDVTWSTGYEVQEVDVVE